MKKYLEKDQLLYLWTLLKDMFNGKVDKVSGKGLSDENYSTAEKVKLESVQAGAQVNAVTSVNGKTGAVTVDVPDSVIQYTEQTLTANQKLQVRTNIGAGTSNFNGDYSALTNKPSIPNKTSQLSNDSGYQNSNDVNTAINSAIALLGNVLDFKGVKNTSAELPTAGNTYGDVWLVKDKSQEYVWVNDSTSDRWESFGGTVDLSGYWSKAELTEITNAEIDVILNS